MKVAAVCRDLILCGNFMKIQELKNADKMRF